MYKYMYIHTLEIINDLPIGFPINNIISLSIYTHVYVYAYMNTYIYIYKNSYKAWDMRIFVG